MSDAEERQSNLGRRFRNAAAEMFSIKDLKKHLLLLAPLYVTVLAQPLTFMLTGAKGLSSFATLVVGTVAAGYYSSIRNAKGMNKIKEEIIYNGRTVQVKTKKVATDRGYVRGMLCVFTCAVSLVGAYHSVPPLLDSVKRERLFVEQTKLEVLNGARQVFRKTPFEDPFAMNGKSLLSVGATAVYRSPDGKAVLIEYNSGKREGFFYQDRPGGAEGWQSSATGCFLTTAPNP